MSDPLRYLRQTFSFMRGSRKPAQALPTTLAACHDEIVKLRIENMRLRVMLEGRESFEPYRQTMGQIIPPGV